MGVGVGVGGTGVGVGGAGVGVGGTGVGVSAGAHPAASVSDITSARAIETVCAILLFIGFLLSFRDLSSHMV